MIKVWVSKNYKELLKAGGFCVDRGKGFKKQWFQEDWPPVRLVILTEEEYEALTTRPFAPMMEILAGLEEGLKIK